VGAASRNVDGHDYVDFCLGDTGAMSGHGPDATLRAIGEQAVRGITTMLPTPFHNMALMSPATNEADVDRHTEIFREAVRELPA
jgi:glutamate-1-semialdehyde aminotransferase